MSRALGLIRPGTMAPVAAILIALIAATVGSGPVAGQGAGLSMLVPAVGLVWVIVGIRRHRPSGRLWQALLLAMVIDVGATAACWMPTLLGNAAPGTPPAGAHAAWVVGELLLAVVLVHMLVRREHRVSALLDVATIAVVVGLLVGVNLIVPDLAAADLSPLQRALYVSDALVQIVLVCVVLRLMAVRNGLSPALWLIAIGVGLQVASHTLWNTLAIAGNYTPGGWADIGSRSVPLLIGLAALHPSMRRLNRPRWTEENDLRPLGALLLGGACLATPVLLTLHPLVPIVPEIDRSAGTSVAIMAAGLLLSGLVIARFSMLLGRARRLTVLARDALDRRTQMLAASEARHRSLLDQLPAVVVVFPFGSTDWRNPPIYVGGQTSSILGFDRSELVDLNLPLVLSRVHPEDRPGLREMLARATRGEPMEAQDFRFMRRDDTEVWLRDAGAVVDDLEGTRALRMLLFDVTDIKAAEAERMRIENEQRLSSKLEGVGQLAAGIAHEINTPIQFVGDTVVFLQRAFRDVMELVAVYDGLMPELAAGGVEPALVERIGEARDVADVDYLTERVPAAFERAGDGIQRVATIVRAMREFAHHTPNAQDPIDLNEVIRNALVVATNAYKYHADVETDLGDLPPVIGNSSDLGQALLNLIVNAGDAVGEAVADSGRRGQIAIRSHQDGDHVAISISDTGCGIPPEVAARIFDPFFTTKAMGRGTGQGLGIVHSIIVERHGGSLTFTSEPGSGTTFHIRLPIEPAHSALPEPAVT